MEAPANEQSDNRGVRKSMRPKKPTIIFDPSDDKSVFDQLSPTTVPSSKEDIPSGGKTRQLAGNQNGIGAEATVLHGGGAHVNNDAGTYVPVIGNGTLIDYATVAPGRPKKVFEYKSLKSWTIQDVASFFALYYPRVSNLFIEHEIDGPALLLLRRHIITSYFNLRSKLALHLFKVVQVLQTMEERKINNFLKKDDKSDFM